MITKWQIQMKGNLLNINTQKCKVCILKQADKLRQTANYHFETKNYSEAINNYNIWLRDFKNLKG